MLGASKLNSIAGVNGPPPVLTGFVGSTVNNTSLFTLPAGTQVGDWVLLFSAVAGNSDYIQVNTAIRGDYYISTQGLPGGGSVSGYSGSLTNVITRFKVTNSHLTTPNSLYLFSEGSTYSNIVIVVKWQNYTNLLEFAGDKNGNGFGSGQTNYLNNNAQGRYVIFKYDFGNDQSASQSPTRTITGADSVGKVRLWESYTNESYVGLTMNYSQQSGYVMMYGYLAVQT
jgi:hypothetical protein